MASFLLFCISHVATSTIDILLQTPKHNFFSLVRASDQTVFDPWRTSPPVSPFFSDFRDQEQIRDFVATHLEKPPSESDLAACQYAILDERSATDQTVILAHSYSSLEMRDPDTMTEDELDRWDTECEEREDEPDDSWREWRVRFEDAEPLPTFPCFECDLRSSSTTRISWLLTRMTKEFFTWNLRKEPSSIQPLLERLASFLLPELSPHIEGFVLNIRGASWNRDMRRRHKDSPR